MKSQDLKEYLSGRKQLTEMGFSSPGAGANTGLSPMWTGRSEKLSNAWQDILVQLEALVLDILDLSQAVYAQILPLLKDIRGSRGESCHENLPRFNAMIQILAQHQDKGEQMSLFMARAQHLMQELQYVCDELAPRDNRVPEAPPRRKDDWLTQKTGMKKPETTFAPPGGSDDRWESTLRSEIKSGTLSDTKNPLAQPPTCPSLVMASLGHAADSISESSGDLEAAFMRAGGAINLCLEQYTDADHATSEISGSAPGTFPRLDVICSWNDSPYAGKASVYWSENGKDRALVIEGRSDGLVRMSENLTDQQVAERIYNCLDTVFDSNPRANTSGATIIPTLYRLLGRVQRGENIQPYQVEQVLEGLRTHIGLSENVGLISDKINLQCESVSASIWSWYYTWEHEYVSPDSMFAAVDGVFGPTFDNPGADVVTEGEYQFHKTMKYVRGGIYIAYLDGPRGKAVLEMQLVDADEGVNNVTFHVLKSPEGLEAKYPVGKVLTVPRSTVFKSFKWVKPPNAFEGVVGEALVSAWQTPKICLNLESAEVYLADEDDKEVLPPDMKDEDAAARLLSLSFQKESLARGKVIEQWQDTLRQEVAALTEGMILTNHRSKGMITPTAGAIKDYRTDPGSLTKACYAAVAYAKRDRKEYVVIYGNSMMQKVYHIGLQSEGLLKYGIPSGTTIQVMLAKPDGSIFQCDAVSNQAKKASTLGEGWEQSFRDSMNEQDDWDAREHPRDRSTGEFVDTDKATAHQFRAAHQAHKDRKKEAGKTPKGPIPTTREPVKPSRSKYDPQDPPKAETPKAPPVEEPKAPPVAEPQTPEVPPPAPAETPPVEQPQAPPPVIPTQPQVPMAPEPQLPKEPKQGKALPQDQPYSPKEGPAPDLPVPPTSEPVKQPRLGEPPTIRPAVPAAPISRDNPDLDAAFGMAPPPGQQPPQAASTISRDNPDLDAALGMSPPEAEAAKQVAQDPELAQVAQEMGVEENPESDPFTQQLLDILKNIPSPEQPPAQPGQPAPTEKDTAEYLRQRKEQLSTAAGKVSRKAYAKDIYKARKFVDSLTPDHKDFPKTQEERQALIRKTAEEYQERRAKWWTKAIAGGMTIIGGLGTAGLVTFDAIYDISMVVEEDPGNIAK